MTPLAEIYDNPLRWLVKSRSHSGAVYLVDLGEDECQCRWHVITVAPALKQGKKVNRCQHYYYAREAFCSYMIEKLKEHYRKQETETK
jgi:hypothetical protein